MLAQLYMEIAKMLLIGFVFLVPTLSFTMKENIIRDERISNKKQIKSLFTVPIASKTRHMVVPDLSNVPSHQGKKISVRNRKRKQSKRRHPRFGSNKEEIEDEKALQRAITFTNPMVPLKFRDTVKKKPKKKNLKPQRLLRKMGEDFESDWMSIDEPHPERSDETTQMSQSQISRLFEQVNSLNLENELRELLEDNSSENIRSNLQVGLEGNKDEKMVDNTSMNITKMASIFTQWLVRKSTCPVTFTWIDLGIYFWPRWIKSGACSAEVRSNTYDYFSSKERTSEKIKERGCSWPKGMRCVQGDVETLQILRWHCRRRRKSHRREKTSLNIESTNSARKRHIHKCRWYKVPYPVTSSCKCACN